MSKHLLTYNIVACVPVMSLYKTPCEAVKETCGSTSLDSHRFKFKWIVPNFSRFIIRYLNEPLITSPTFGVFENNSEFHLVLGTYLVNYPRATYLSLRLQCNTIPSEVCMKHKLTLMKNGDVLEEFNIGPRKIKNGFSYEHKCSAELNSVNSGDKLTIICEGECITVDTLPTLYYNAIASLNPPQFEYNESQIFHHFGNLLEEDKYSDITLCVQGKEFKVHKLILATQSPVFRAMFDHEMKEAQENRVLITDLDQEVISEMLYFMYTGKLQNLDKIGFGLLAAADKYALEELKMICGKDLCNKLSVENAVGMLKMADLHNAKELKDYVVHFMNKHVNTSVLTKEWFSMLKTQEHLVEIFQALKDQKNK